MPKLSQFTKTLIHFVIALLLFTLIREVWATPGGLDSSGCHQGKRAGYHCHTAKPPNQMSVIESPEARVKRLQKECVGKPKTGPCRRVQK